MTVKWMQCAGAAAACSVLLAGCQSLPVPPLAEGCGHDACTVQVHVSCIKDTCWLWLPPWQYTVNARGNNVFWQLQADADGKHFRFDPAKGIRFKAQGNGFSCMPIGDNQFKCDNGKVPGYHEYGINVIGDVKVPELDPWVVNFRN